MDTIQLIVEYFKDLAGRHNEVGGFLTGEEYETNQSLHTYPLIWLQFPLTATPITNANGDTMQVDFNLICYSNVIKDVNDNDVVITEGTVQSPYDQLSFTGLIAQDQLMSNTFRIINQILAKFNNDIEEGIFQARILSNELTTVERVLNDDVYGTQLSLTIEVENIYACNFESAFITN